MSATLAPATRRTAVMPAALALAIGLVALGLVFLPECRAAVKVWIDSTAYGHCFLVAPIAAYLVWDRRDTLRGLSPHASPALALLAIPLGLAWFAAERLGIMEGRQLVTLGFVELLFLVVLGWRLYLAMLGPLLYLVFLVPFGAFLTPVLQSFTARFIDLGLNVLGISHYVSDMVIEISAGTFFVAEACAGLRFLIAAIAFGVFYALLNYRSPGRRLFFIAISIVVPIIANGIRALGIVVLGHVLGSAEAAAADHIIYGWVFFSAVMLLLVLVGMPLREASAAAPVRPLPRQNPGPFHAWPALLVLVLAALAPAAALALNQNVASASLAANPSFAAPAGCRLTPGATTPNRYEANLVCDRDTWNLVIQTLPTRSTGSAVAEARSRIVGSLGAEDATTTSLRNAPPHAGNWQLVVSREPELIVATALWLHGQPAPGGLAQRLMQARDSVFGNDTPPLLIALTNRPTRAMTEAQLDLLVAELTRILATQPDLNAEAARLTRPIP